MSDSTSADSIPHDQGLIVDSLALRLAQGVEVPFRIVSLNLIKANASSLGVL